MPKTATMIGRQTSGMRTNGFIRLTSEPARSNLPDLVNRPVTKTHQKGLVVFAISGEDRWQRKSLMMKITN